MRNRDDSLVCVGVISGVHGVRGQVRIKWFTEAPENLIAYSPLASADGATSYKLGKAEIRKDTIVAAIDGITDRNQAEALKGVELYVRSSRFEPPAEDEWFYSDLVGLSVRDGDDEDLGTLIAVQNYGAGDLLEVRFEGRKNSVFLPFDRETVTEVNIQDGFVRVPNPDMWLDDTDRNSGKQAQDES